MGIIKELHELLGSIKGDVESLILTTNTNGKLHNEEHWLVNYKKFGYSIGDTTLLMQIDSYLVGVGDGIKESIHDLNDILAIYIQEGKEIKSYVKGGK